MSILRTLFEWPDGILLGNLIASALWAVPGILHLDRLARRHHREQSEQAARHHAEHMKALGYVRK